MKIPLDAIIDRRKLTEYLLLPQPKNDKSGYLAQVGFTLLNPDELEVAIRQLISEQDAVLDRHDKYGAYFNVTGPLVSPDGRAISVVTVWIVRTEEDGVFRFITLKPGARRP